MTQLAELNISIDPDGGDCDFYSGRVGDGWDNIGYVQAIGPDGELVGTGIIRGRLYSSFSSDSTRKHPSLAHYEGDRGSDDPAWHNAISALEGR